jgi:uncharacterized repeat protein (TIGR03833 family)
MRDQYNFSESIINPYKNKEQGSTMDGKERKNIMSGKRVSIVLKEDQSTGRLTEGVVRDILTKSPNHPHGIKVRLMSGEVGRVKEVF